MVLNSIPPSVISPSLLSHETGFRVLDRDTCCFRVAPASDSEGPEDPETPLRFGLMLGEWLVLHYHRRLPITIVSGVRVREKKARFLGLCTRHWAGIECRTPSSGQAETTNCYGYNGNIFIVHIGQTSTMVKLPPDTPIAATDQRCPYTASPAQTAGLGSNS